MNCPMETWDKKKPKPCKPDKYIESCGCQKDGVPSEKQ